MNDELLMKKQVNACLNYHCEEYTIACFSRHREARSNLAHCAFNNPTDSCPLLTQICNLYPPFIANYYFLIFNS